MASQTFNKHCFILKITSTLFTVITLSILDLLSRVYRNSSANSGFEQHHIQLEIVCIVFPTLSCTLTSQD